MAYEPKVSGEFTDVNVGIIREIKGTAPFDIYIRRAAGKYTKLFPRDEAVDLARLDHYEHDKDIESLSVKTEDFKDYLALVERLAISFFESELRVPSDDIAPVLSEMINLVTIEILSKTDVSSSEVRNAEMTVRGCVKLLGQNPKKMIEILRMLSRHPYSLRHAIASSIFALLLADTVEIKTPKAKEMIGMGALLHDIGMSRLPFNPEEESDLDSEQWRLVKEHPQLGKRILDTVPQVPREVATIILEHHEQPNGMGYPNGLHGSMIFGPSKIVSIADSFSALLSVRPFREKPLGAAEALEIMRDDRGKFDPKLLEIFSLLILQKK